MGNCREEPGPSRRGLASWVAGHSLCRTLGEWLWLPTADTRDGKHQVTKTPKRALKDNKWPAPKWLHVQTQTESNSLTTQLLEIHYFFQTEALKGSEWLSSGYILRKQQNNGASHPESHHQRFVKLTATTQRRRSLRMHLEYFYEMHNLIVV